jgi:hypothetical protein
MAKFDLREESAIYRIVNQRLARRDKHFEHGYLHSILFRRGNRFVVSVHADRPDPRPWEPDGVEQYTWHVVMEIAWRDGVKGIRTLYDHEAGYNVYDGPFRCSACLSEFPPEQRR